MFMEYHILGAERAALSSILSAEQNRVSVLKNRQIFSASFCQPILSANKIGRRKSVICTRLKMYGMIRCADI